MNAENTMASSGTAEAQAEQFRMLSQVCPLEVDMLGESTVQQIISGSHFKEFTEGSHIDLTQTIALLSAVATLIQTALQVRASHAHGAMSPDEIDRLVKDSLDRKMGTHNVIGIEPSNDPDLVEKIVKETRRDSGSGKG